MKRIVVTGGAGRLGRLAIAELLQQGYEVLAVDRTRPERLQCRFLEADLTNAAAVYDVLAGCDGVLHLGAIPGPTVLPASVIFENNVRSTQIVVDAAAALGVQRLIFASSVFALGWHEEPDRYWPEYVPVDEEHPLTPFEAYGLSKQIGETICAAASRRTGMPTVSLRLMNIIQPDGYFALPWPSPTSETGVRFVMWPYVDARDAARACRLALEAETSGHEALYIAAEETRFEVPTRELLRRLAPSSLEIRGPLEGCRSVISIEKARRLIGFEPLYGWRDQKPVGDQAS